MEKSESEKEAELTDKYRQLMIQCARMQEAIETAAESLGREAGVVQMCGGVGTAAALRETQIMLLASIGKQVDGN